MTDIVLFQGINVKSRLTAVWYVTLAHVKKCPAHTHGVGESWLADFRVAPFIAMLAIASVFPQCNCFLSGVPQQLPARIPHLKALESRSIILHFPDHSGSCEACVLKGSTFKCHIPYLCSLSLLITH